MCRAHAWIPSESWTKQGLQVAAEISVVRISRFRTLFSQQATILVRMNSMMFVQQNDRRHGGACMDESAEIGGFTIQHLIKKNDKRFFDVFGCSFGV